jgi:phosphoketolase
VRVIYMLEPGRFRRPRTTGEERHCAPGAYRESLYPSQVRPRIFSSHTRPETMLGVLTPLSTGEATAGLGFVNQGGTLNTAGMLFVNRCSWAHIVRTAAGLLGIEESSLLSAEELRALRGEVPPQGILMP